ncbi:FAD-dependent oxidoreductase [Candidatus Neomarinimicrobiota bacterium]
MAKNNPAQLFQEIIGKEKSVLTVLDHEDEKLIIEPIEPSPCTQACPAGVNVKSYVSLIASGRFAEALEVVRERNPLPGICGRICTHPCESYCNRSTIDAPVAICSLKRFIADYELANPHLKPKKIPQTKKEKIAIIGSGPAGLTAANDLIRNGYGVTIYEALAKPGGMLVAGIPSYRLPRPIIDSEIDAIKKLGVRIKTNSKISGKDAVKKIFSNGYSAVFLAIGAHKGKKLNIPGESKYSGIIDCVDFLNQTNLKHAPKLGDRVIVIGGGNSAIDSARTAVRLGSKEVHIIYRRTRKEMPANEAEIHEAEQEGVLIHYLSAPVKIIGFNKKVTGIECLKMKLGKPDESGRRRPLPIKGSEFIVEANNIIPAISQEPELEFLADANEFDLTKWNTFAVDDYFATNVPGVFAGGDAITGPNTVIDAIAHGHLVADSINAYLSKSTKPITQSSTRVFETEIKIDLQKQRQTARKVMPSLSAKTRNANFKEVELGFDESTAIAEAQRCLRCGPCNECHICVTDCDKLVNILSSPNGLGEFLLRLPPEKKGIINGDTAWNGMISYRKQQFPLKIDTIFPKVRKALCRGCGDCVNVCDYDAIQLVQESEDKQIAQINTNICRGCGTCIAHCSTGAMIPSYNTQDWLTQRLFTIDPKRKNVVVFTCHWNGSHVDETAFPDFSSDKTQIIFIHLMCSGRLESSFVLQALEAGADGVLVTGCSEDSCHYEFGAKVAVTSFEKTKQLVRMIGFDTRRIQHQKITGNDTEQFTKKVNEFVSAIKKIKPEITKDSLQSEQALGV